MKIIKMIKKKVDNIPMGIDYTSIKSFYVLPMDVMLEFEPSKMDMYDLKNPNETLKTLESIKDIYDRRNINYFTLNEEISNLKSLVREKRFENLLDKSKK